MGPGRNPPLAVKFILMQPGREFVVPPLALQLNSVHLPGLFQYLLLISGEPMKLQ